MRSSSFIYSKLKKKKKYLFMQLANSKKFVIIYILFIKWSNTYINKKQLKIILTKKKEK